MSALAISLLAGGAWLVAVVVAFAVLRAGSNADRLSAEALREHERQVPR